MELILIRHALPVRRELDEGIADPELSPAGHAQARHLAEYLASEPIDALYTSPLERARETAEPTERLTSLTASLDDGLLECDFGEWTGEKLTALAKLPQWRTVQQAPSTFRFPGGESFVELQSRMIATMERLRAAHPGGVVVCFSHADPIKAILTHALGTHLDHFQRVDVGTGSISAIQWPDGAAPIVRMVNSTGGPLAALRSG